MTLDGRTAVYKADATDSEGKRWPSITPGDPEKEVAWRSLATMPRVYSRISGIVTKSRVCRIGEVKGVEAAIWGFGGSQVDRGIGHPIAALEAVAFWQETYGDYTDNPWAQVAYIKRTE